MKFEIWHASNPTFSMNDHPKFPSEMTMIGYVEAMDEEDAFRLTNSINSLWFKNKEVTLAEGISGARSFSVGDVFINTETGVRLRCEFSGFTEF